MNRIQHAKDKMNRLGAERTPFLFIIDFLMQKPIVIPLSEVDSEHILFKTSIAENFHGGDPIKKLPFKPLLEKNPLTYDEYKLQFDKVLAEIKKGNSFVVNLTTQTPIRLEVNLKSVFFAC